jgi:hypothetical protein
VRSANAANCATVDGMDTTRATAMLLRYADHHHAPASFVAMLWRLRGQPHQVQVERLGQLVAALSEGHRAALARER